MESFYGGPQGASWQITGVFQTYAELVDDFKSPTCDVHVGEYGLINTVLPPLSSGNTATETINSKDSSWLNRYHPDYGKVYRRELDGTAKYVGNISGPPGPANTWTFSGIGLQVTKAQYDNAANTVTLQLSYSGSGESVESFTIVANKDKNAVIESLNATLTAKVINDHPLYRGMPVYVEVRDATPAQKATAYPTMYFTMNWASDIPYWVYIGNFLNIARTNILGISHNSSEDSAELYKTLYDGGVNFIAHKESNDILTAQCAIMNYPTGGNN